VIYNRHTFYKASSPPLKRGIV